MNRVDVTKLRFLCPTHSEAKQTKTSEFGAEEGLLQGPQGAQVASVQKRRTPQRVSAKHLIN